MGDTIIEKSFSFAVRIVYLHRYLVQEKSEYVLSKQLLRSGTSIGANVREAEYGQSKKDFLAKMYIALKECNETAYWLELLTETKYLTPVQTGCLLEECVQLRKILQSITKTTRENLEK